MRARETVTRLVGLGTALPPNAVTREDTAAFLWALQRRRGAPAQPGHGAQAIERLARGSGVATRYSVLPDFGRDPGPDPIFSAEAAPPGTAARMRVYERESVPLAARAAAAALAEAGVAPASVTHLIVSTCTGCFAPGPDLGLVERLGLPADVRRTVVGFMGCYAGFNGMRLADDAVRADPDAVVLQVAVELCSLHLQPGPEWDLLVADCLFGDGAGAAVYVHRDRAGGARALDAGVAASAARVAPDSSSQMTWRVGDEGFVMRLAAHVPATLQRGAAPFVDALLDAASLGRGAVRAWAVHPGGPRILGAVAEALGLDRDPERGPFADSWGVLRDVGNLSSATLFFVLDRALRRADGPLVALGFGPGLTMEGAVLSPGRAAGA